MKHFTLRQACEVFQAASRMVSVRRAAILLSVFCIGVVACVPRQALALEWSTYIVREIRLQNIVTYVVIILFILCISFLMHREIRKSRSQARNSSTLLRTERDNLEERIALRTKELIVAETKHLDELNRTATFGQLSQGLFHDLMSPLSSISLYIEKLGLSKQESEETHAIVRKIVQVSNRMNSFMESVRRAGTGSQAPASSAEISEELVVLNDILSYKARMAGVTISMNCPRPIHLPLHTVRLHQLLLNLASNAIEACVEAKEKSSVDTEYIVRISATRYEKATVIKVSDNGSGMSHEQVASVFKKSFTTKKHGTGTGLMTVRSIVEDELQGTLQVQSKVGAGTTFTVTV